MDSEGELAILFPVARPFAIGGRTVQIKRAGIRHGQQVIARAVQLGTLMADDADEYMLVDEHPDEAADLLAFALEVDREWAMTLSAIEKIDLGLEWLKENRDFFFRDLPQARQRLRAAIQEFVGAGPMPSTTLNHVDTLEPMTTPLPPSISGSPPLTATNGDAAPPV